VDDTAFVVADTSGNTSIAGWTRHSGDVEMEGNQLYFDLAHRAMIEASAGNIDVTAASTSTVDLEGLGATVQGWTRHSGDVEMEGNQLYLDLGHTAYIDGAAGDLNFTVPATETVDIVNGGLNVAGSAAVTGLSTLNGGIFADAGAFRVADTSGNIHTTGTLDVNGNSTITGTLTTKTRATFAQGLLLQNDLYAWGQNIKLDTGGTAYIYGSAGNITVGAPSTATVTIGGAAFTVDTGVATFTGGLTTGTGKFTVDSSTGDVTLETGASIMPTGGVTNTGVIFNCASTLAYTNTTNKGMCRIPANANIVDYLISVSVAFNDSGTDLIDCGTSWGTTTELFSDVNGELTVVGRPGSTTALGDVGATPKTIWCEYTGQNGNSSAGSAVLVVYYIVD